MGMKTLLVEGSDDQDFFSVYCDLLSVENVNVIPPKALNSSTGDGCGNLIANLPILLNQIKAGDVDRLAIILDADYPPNNNGGFDKKFKLIADQLIQFGYIVPKKPKNKTGVVFTHSDGLSPIGLWVMPNHQDDGMLEDFVENMITDVTQVDLLRYAEKSIASLPTTLFNKKLHLVKAKVFTWRAWQKRPGICLSKALQDGILDRSRSVNFEDWLKKVFK